MGEAIELYLNLARAYPQFAHVHFKLGYLFLISGDPPSAIRHFTIDIDRATQIRAQETEDSVHSHHRASQAVVEMPQSLVGVKQTPVQQRTFLFCAHAGRSEAHRQLKQDTEAENDTLYIENRGGNTAHSLIAMGVLYCHFGMLQRAEACFQKCAVIDANDPDYLIAHAELMLGQRRYMVATSMFERCRQKCKSSSLLYHRALIGEGTALLRQDKLQQAVILVLQAMNTLRAYVRERNALSESQAAGMFIEMSSSSQPESFSELVFLYQEATNLYGGLCLMKGELKAALDTYHAALQGDLGPSFQLPPICVLPGTKDKQGDLVDSTKLSSKNLGEIVRHLNELEWRYGPDACLYFHRASIHRALGEIKPFVRDLSLVESLDPQFVRYYIQRDALGDFLDVETISWIPMRFIDAIHSSLEKNEYKIPASSKLQVSSPMSQSRRKNRRPGSTADTRTNQFQFPMFSEFAMFEYFQERIKNGSVLEEYANVFQLDIFRRLPISRRNLTERNRLGSQLYERVSQWEGVILDIPDIFSKDQGDRESYVRELVQTVRSKYDRHPCVHMIAGMIELDLFNASQAQVYFTEAINLLERQARFTQVGSSSTVSKQWQQMVMERVKYYCFVWRSMASRLNIDMEKAVEDLNLAAAVKFGENTRGSGETLLLAQRSIIMLLNGHLKSAHKLVKELARQLKLTKKNFKFVAGASERDTSQTECISVMDMFGNAGLNSFHLLPLQVGHEIQRISRMNQSGTSNVDDLDRDDEESNDKAEDDRQTKKEEEMAVNIVKYALEKKAANHSAGSAAIHTEMFDKFFDSGLLKLSSTGSITQVTPFFQAILSMDESYLPPTNFASLEIFKCKEQDFMEEKLYNCFVRLGKRSKWLQKYTRWRFEALIDANLAHAYLPTDLETLWHRARLLFQQRNNSSAIHDFTLCLDLMRTQFTWEKKNKTGTKMKATFNNATKRTQWLQLLLERGQAEMALGNWEKSIQDLTMAIDQAGKENLLLRRNAYEARSTSLIHLKRYGHAIQDLQYLLGSANSANKVTSTGKAESPDSRQDEESLLNCVLIGNLYCQLAINQTKTNATTLSNDSFVQSSEHMETHSDSGMGFVSRAATYYDDALKISPAHFIVHYFRGRMLVLAGKARAAIQSFSDCLRLHPMFLPALFLRGCIYAQEDLIDLALADFYRVRHRVPSYPHLYTSIGYCHFQRSDLTKAVETLTEALQHDSNDVDALYIRGCALQELFVLDNAAKDFSRVLTIDPRHFRALYQRAVCETLKSQYTQAVRDLDTALRFNLEWRDARILHAYACFCCGRYDEAINSYGRAIDVHDAISLSKESSVASQKDSMLFLYRALANMYAEQFPAAVMDVDSAIKRDDSNYVGFLAKAYLLMKTGDSDKAVHVLTHCLRNYKKIALMPATDVLDDERAKAMRNNQESEPVASSIMNPFTTDTGNNQDALPTQQVSIPKITADPEVLFHRRKCARDEKHDSKSNRLQRHVDKRHGGQSHAPLARQSSVVRSTMPRLASSSEIKPPPSDECEKPKVHRSKFWLAMKKLVSEHRVLRALDRLMNASSKKNQRMVRLLAEVMQPVAKVPWPKGTLTTNVLVWAMNTLGIHFLMSRKIDDALMSFSLAIQANPFNATTYFNRGNVFLHIDVLGSAVTGFQDAVDVEENCFEALNNMGVALFHMKRLDDAQEAFSTGLHHVQDSKKRAVLLYNLGVSFQAVDKQDEAMDFYQQAIALDGSRSEFYNNRSSILHQQLKFTVALDDYNRALTLHDRSAGATESKDQQLRAGSCIEAQLNRAQLYIAMGNSTSALKDLRAALKSLIYGRERVVAKDRASFNPDMRNCGPEDEELVSELLTFCEKWHDTMRIATKDFLFGFDTFPCFAAFKLFMIFGDALIVSHAERAADNEDGQASLQQLCVIPPLPILDPSFYDFGRAFSHIALCDNNEDEIDTSEDDERDSIVGQSKQLQLEKAYGSDLRSAIQSYHERDYECASRYLLRAHYKTNMDTHDEYFIMISHVQVELKTDLAFDEMDLEVEPNYAKAIATLREFLSERRSIEEIKEDNRSGGDRGDSKKNAMRAKLNSELLDSEDPDELTEQEINWRQQRRIIRADAFTYLGCLHQLNGEFTEAKDAFMRALRLRDDHVYALLNYLQLSVADSDYEPALDAIMQLLSVALASNSNAIRVTGLLDADRSAMAMLPTIGESFAAKEMAEFGGNMQFLMKDYRGLLGPQIQANTSQIFRRQGTLARLVQEIRQFLKEQLEAAAAAENPTSSEENVFDTLQLEEFNRILDEYSSKVMDGIRNSTTASADDELYTAFQSQFDQMCGDVVQSLPPEKVPQNIHAEILASQALYAQNQLPDSTIEEFLSSIDKSSSPARKLSSSNKSRRPLSTSTPLTARPPHRTSTLVDPQTIRNVMNAAENATLTPRRPQSGPHA